MARGEVDTALGFERCRWLVSGWMDGCFEGGRLREDVEGEKKTFLEANGIEWNGITLASALALTVFGNKKDHKQHRKKTKREKEIGCDEDWKKDLLPS